MYNKLQGQMTHTCIIPYNHYPYTVIFPLSSPVAETSTLTLAATSVDTNALLPLVNASSHLMLMSFSVYNV